MNDAPNPVSNSSRKDRDRRSHNILRDNVWGENRKTLISRSCTMIHDLRSRHKRFDFRMVVTVHLMKFHRCWHVIEFATYEIVNPYNGMSESQHRISEVAPEKPSYAGDENFIF